MIEARCRKINENIPLAKEKTMTEKSKRNQGILFILGASMGFACMNLFVSLAGDLPTMEKCFFRNVVAMIVMFFIILRSKEGFAIGKGNLKYLFIRAASGTMGLICNFYAIGKLNISDASMLNKLSPFFAIIFSVFVLKEVANRYEWIAVIIAFIGALFVIKPGAGVVSMPALIGVLGGLGAGLAYTFVRVLGKRGERGNIIVLFFSTFSTIITFPLMIMNFEPMTIKQLIFLIMAGVSAMMGQICITKAYTKAPAKEISVFDYSQVVFAAILGLIFLGQIPDIYSIIGYVIIIGVAIWKWWYGLRISET